MTEEEQCVHALYDNDPFSKWLGIELCSIEEGRVEISMRVKREMLNGFEILHGGVFFSLADSALAFAANTRNKLSVALDAHIQFPASAEEGDLLYAKAEEVHVGRKTAMYRIVIRKENGTICAVINGTVYRTSRSVIDVD